MKHIVVMALAVLGLSLGEGLGAEPGMPGQEPPKMPESRIDPGIQVDPGPTRDPRAIVPPAKNPDPNMAINPEAAPPSRSEAEQSKKRGKEKDGRLPREGQAGSEGEGAKGPGIPLPK